MPVGWAISRPKGVPQEVRQQGGALRQARSQRKLPGHLCLKMQARRLSRRPQQLLSALGSQCQDRASAHKLLLLHYCRLRDTSAVPVALAIATWDPALGKQPQKGKQRPVGCDAHRWGGRAGSQDVAQHMHAALQHPAALQELVAPREAASHAHQA